MIYYKSVRTSRKSSIQLVFLHDFFDYHYRYSEMGFRLKELLPFELEVTWMDFKGHGMSAGTRGHIENFDELSADARFLLQLIRKKNEHQTIIVIGQGLGALVALQLIDSHTPERPILDYSILLSPLIHFGKPMMDMNHSRITKYLPFLKKVGLPVKLDFSKICNDEAKIHDLKSDPLIRNRISLGMLSEIMKASHQIKKYSYYMNLPTLFLAGEEDVFLNKDHLALFVKGIPEHHATFRLYNNAKHDLANDKNREMMFNDISKWIYLQMEGRL